ncbi:hypothetical protein O0L34_g13598 [Tuta absoluta]|nr:hypothetical protein O0L34_g13598 [Tuta absoluta]
MKISFKINGKLYEVDGKYGPDVSLNEYIRNVADLKGTKVMCQEGGCGACIVAVRAPVPPSNDVKVFSVNSCLVSALSCHGWEVTTVEGIGNRTAGYHTIQRRLANFNGTQCGYCTPGWITSMYSLFKANKHMTTKEIENSFAGNICRCTGYRSISDAVKSFASDANEDLKKQVQDMEDLDMFKACGAKCSKKCLHSKACGLKISDQDEFQDATGGKIHDIENVSEETDWCIIEDNKMIEVDCGTSKWLKPYNLSDVFKAMGRGSEYKLVAGNTGQGVYHVTDYPQVVIDIFNVAELKGYQMDVNLILGAGMPLNEMMELFLDLAAKNEDFSYLKQFYDHMDLVAHVPVRNIGTIAGNLFLKYHHNDFQSDVFLLFETVGAMVTIAEAPNVRKQLLLPEFLKTDMKGKIMVNVMLPPLSKCCLVKTYKIMPRSQNAHAVVNAGFLFKFKQNSTLLDKATIVFGSISPTFIHASHTEALLAGKDPFTDETLQMALKSLDEEVHPEEAPPEPGAGYRKMLALALYYKAILSLCPEERVNPKYRSGGEAIKRSTSRGTQVFDTDKSVWPLNQPIPKLEALVQCSGEATFANDLPAQVGEVYGAFVTADVRAGSVIGSFDASEALKVPGVIAFYSAKDIPGDNTFTPLNIPIVVVMNEEILCSGKVLFYGQPAGIIVADREKTAIKAARLVKIKYTSESKTKPMLTAEDVLASPERDQRTHQDAVIEAKETGHNVKTVIFGDISFPSQYHYTMEPQTCVVKPTEDGYEVYSSSQWLDLTNVAVAQCLKVPVNSVQAIVRRVGGAYGAKITRSSQVACAAAIVSHYTGKTCRFVLPIETNMRIIGKRLPTYVNFEIGTNSDGLIQYLKTKFYQNNGCSSNETISPLTLKHVFNCYETKRWHLEANSVLTDMPSNTWCRSPASTEGIAMIEHMMDRIAFNLRKDPLEVRLLNMSKEDNPLPQMIDQIKRDSNYDNRVENVKRFNNNNRWRKRAIKILPMKYELFYIGPYNSLISVYHGDGSVMITHGGIEMGQGLNTKVAQVCAYALGIPLEKISVKPSTSFFSPNNAPTGASIGSECVSLATMKACEILKERLKPVKEKMGNVSWEELIEAAFKQGVPLQASYMFTPADVQIYFIYGVVVLEAEVDILTGNHEVIRVDLLEDVGRSLSPQIDVTQIEGAFIMGLGYWTSEKLEYDPDTGRILTDRTWTYKPPGIKDIPADFRIYFQRNSRNPYGVLQSKATGEPALCLAVVITHAFREAVRSARLDAGYEDQWVDIRKYLPPGRS